MIIEVNLPSFLQPYKNKNLIRLGNDYDGGYLVDKNIVRESDALISFGISYDWSFEKDFFKLNRCDIFTFDGSVGVNFFYAKVKNRIKNTFKNINLSYLSKTIWWLIIPLRFFTFFNNINFGSRRKHHEMFVYENTKNIDIEYFFKKNGYKPKFIKFRDILDSFITKEKIFLKIDIEGDEYSLLDLIIEYQSKISSLIIEFHNLDKKNYEIVKEFNNKLDLTLCHTHINISGNFNNDKSPRVIELTYTQNLGREYKVETLPHHLDMETFQTDNIYEISFVN